MLNRVHAVFETRFDSNPLLVASPGRINLIGEHTDYNDGFVLPAAIDRRIYLALAPNNTAGLCRIVAADFDASVSVDLDTLAPLEGASSWANYVLGVVAELRADGRLVEGFDCVFAGDIPIGGGLSSSAALENATAVGLNEAFDLGLDQAYLLRVSQRAEHHYAGVKCGIMDQFASMMGQAGRAMLLDCRTLTFEYVPLELGDYGLILCDTNVSHALASSEYNTRRQECEEAVRLLKPAFPSIRALRDVTLVGLEAERHRLSPVLHQRARHVVSENERVHLAVAALREGNLRRLGELLYQSHDSLQHDYEVSCPELDFLVDQTRDKNYVLGARMMGGGFGGCTLNLVEKKHAETFIVEIREAYRRHLGREMKDYAVQVGDGARVVGD